MPSSGVSEKSKSVLTYIKYINLLERDREEKENQEGPPSPVRNGTVVLDAAHWWDLLGTHKALVHRNGRGTSHRVPAV